VSQKLQALLAPARQLCAKAAGDVCEKRPARDSGDGASEDQRGSGNLAVAKHEENEHSPCRGAECRHEVDPERDCDGEKKVPEHELRLRGSQTKAF
jgi:hypothetical protein